MKKNDLDIEKIITVSACFTGQHDFSNFARIEQAKDPVRAIDNIVFSDTKDLLIIDFFAPTFLWNQIRRIISALVKIGKNEVDKQQIVEALCNPDKNVDFGLAPAEPLFLKDVFYDFDFEYDKFFKKEVEEFEKRIISEL